LLTAASARFARVNAHDLTPQQLIAKKSKFYEKPCQAFSVTILSEGAE
jgi:hypothetical protein